MSSLIRRSLRTTAATAGIAAVGIGLAGPAFAAPELLPVPQAPDAGGVESGDSGETRAADRAREAADRAPVAPGAPLTEALVIPGYVYFEMPTVSMVTSALPAGDVFDLPAAPALPGASTVPAAPVEPAAPAAPAEAEAPAASGIGDAVGFDAADAVELDTNLVQGPSTGPLSEGQNNVGAMQSLDMAALAIQMAQNIAAGDSVTENQQIG